jgi:hypothetical protein
MATTTRQRWSQLERRLWLAIRRGDEVDVRAEALDPGHIWGPARTVRAEVIRELLVAPPSPLPGRVPSLQLSGARVTGILDLSHARIDTPFNFEECWFDERMSLYAARTRTIYLQGCRVPGMYAEELRTDGELNLHGVLCTGVLDLDNTHISGPLTLTDAQLSNPGGVALRADNAEFGGDVLCNGDFRAHDTIRMAGVHIEGDLDLTAAHLDNPGGVALWADSARIGGDLAAFGLLAVGRIHLSAATIGRSLMIANATFDNPEEEALDCRGVHVAGQILAGECTIVGGLMLMSARVDDWIDLANTVISARNITAFNGVDLHAAAGLGCMRLEVTGTVSLSSAHIGKVLSFSGATLSNPGSDALIATRLTVGGNAHFDEEFSTTGSIGLAGAHIHGQLNFTDATLSNPGAIALYAPALEVESSFVADGCRFDGQLHIIGARVAADLYLDGATLVHDGRALMAEDLTVGRNLRFCNGFSCTGQMALGGTHVGHQVMLRGATLRDPDGYALRASHLTVGEDIFADEEFAVHGSLDLSPCRVNGMIDLATENIEGTVDLGQARADVLRLSGKPRGEILLTDMTVRVLEHHPVDWPQEHGLDLQGLTYASLQPLDLPVGQWLKWLRRGLPEGYRPQPYAQLATMLRTVGNDRDSRVVLLARQRHRRKHLPLWSKPWGWLQDLAVGYGYVPWRAAGWLGVLWLAGWLYFRDQQPLPQPPGSTTDYQPALYALDLLLPVLSIGQRNAIHFGGVAQGVAVLITVCSWILGIAVLAGLTRALTRN